MAGTTDPRCVALVGPYLSGKTTLLEAMLMAAGRIQRKGSVPAGNTVGDASPESREREMSTEINVANFDYLGDHWTVLDCPGSVEFQQDTRHALMVADMAVVVCEPSVDKAMMTAPVLKFLDDHEIPHCLFLNKIDHMAGTTVPEMMEALQGASDKPLVLRHVPIANGEAITGYVDLASERAYEYQAGSESKLIQVPSEMEDDGALARQEMLESLADFDDGLLEQLLEDAIPPKEEVYGYLTATLRSDSIVPVFIGSAQNDAGIRRLLKVLRHEAPGVASVRERLELGDWSGNGATVFKTLYMPHTGKLSIARVLDGEIKDGMSLNGNRVSGMNRLNGYDQEKVSRAERGDVVALGRMEAVRTGETLVDGGDAPDTLWPPPAMSLFALAVEAEKREDEVKLTGAMGRMAEEDPSLILEHNQDTRELVLAGQGEIHLKVAIGRLKSKYNLTVAGRRPKVAYKETIKQPVSQHARHKKQSGGHGQFGDVHVDIKPLPRGAGFEFQDTIVGGRVPRQYIPAVEAGVKEYMSSGPLGFPVVDVSVTLTDGQYHSVDSSDQAFKTAGSLAMREGMPKARPVLLEPIYDVKISAPSHFTSNIQGLISGRRGQILGFDSKAGWNNWDEISAKLPQAELQDLIIELRSLTQGVGTFEYAFDYLQELTGRLADQVVQAYNEDAG
ncbi:MAG: elongation factor G [Rhodospirillaceae bacterium]|nr:elongation factor G [Rhodospirillaceae bacterium]